MIGTLRALSARRRALQARSALERERIRGATRSLARAALPALAAALAAGLVFGPRRLMRWGASALGTFSTLAAVVRVAQALFARAN